MALNQLLLSFVPDNGLGNPLVALVTGAATWIAWYAYRFVLTPLLYPDEPKELPYLIPVLGHVISMTRNGHALFSYGREYFGNTRQPFVITVMGQSNYIITSPEDVLAVYRAPKALDYNPFVKEILASFGLTRDTIGKIYNDHGSGKTWMDSSHDNFKLQMHPGQRFEDLQKVFLAEIETALTWEKINGHMVISEDEKRGKDSVSV